MVKKVVNQKVRDIIRAARMKMEIPTEDGILTKDDQGFKLNGKLITLSVNEFYDFIEQKVSDDVVKDFYDDILALRTNLTMSGEEHLQGPCNGEILLRGLEEGKQCLLPNKLVIKIDDEKGLVSYKIGEDKPRRYYVTINKLFSLASNITNVDIINLLHKNENK